MEAQTAYVLLFCFFWFSNIVGQTTTEQLSCSESEWKCSNNNCVRISDRCDGRDDCGDNSDEEHCELWSCPARYWPCNNRRCVWVSQRCDGRDNCGDGSDERNCDHWSCPAVQWKCSNNRCVWFDLRCDGQDDCGDSSDEENCGTVQIDHPRYLMENQNHTYGCRSYNMSQPSNVTWPGHSQTNSLSLYNIQRADNGTQYTCVVTADDIREEAVYILRVAYGPFTQDMLVGPSYLASNGSQPVTLTCNATNVYPTPYYTWSGVTCEEQSPPNTCTFTPDLATDDLRNVTCTAVSLAADEERQYFIRGASKSASRNLQLNFLYKVGVESLTLNGTNETVTVNEDDHAMIHLVCKVFGRPVFTTVTITKGNDTLGPSRILYKTSGRWHFEPQMTLPEVQCHDMGTYTCTADNGVDEPDTNSILLNVRCPPRDISRIHQNMSEGRLDFTFDAYPVPEKFVFINYGDEIASTGTVVPSDLFSPKCQQDSETEYMVNCRVRLHDVPSGFYRTYVHNNLGNAWFTFSIEEIQDNVTEPQGIISTVLWFATWGTVGVGVIVVIVIVVVVICRWCCTCCRSRAVQVTDLTKDDSSGVYEEIDELPIRRQANPPPLPAPRHDVSIPQSRDAGGASVSPVSKQQSHPLLADPLPKSEEGVNMCTEERFSNPPGSQSRPQLPVAGIPIAVIIEHEPNPFQSEPQHNRTAPSHGDAQWAAAATDSGSDAEQGAEIVMSTLGTKCWYQNAYELLPRARASAYFTYSRLDTSLTENGAQQIDRMLVDRDSHKSDAQDNDYMQPVSHMCPNGSHEDSALQNSQDSLCNQDDDYLIPVPANTSTASTAQTVSQLHHTCRDLDKSFRKPPLPIPIASESHDESEPEDETYLLPVPDNRGETPSPGLLTVPTVAEESHKQASRDNSTKQTPSAEHDEVYVGNDEMREPTVTDFDRGLDLEDDTFLTLDDTTSQDALHLSSFFKSSDESSSEDDP